MFPAVPSTRTQIRRYPLPAAEHQFLLPRVQWLFLNNIDGSSGVLCSIEHGCRPLEDVHFLDAVYLGVRAVALDRNAVQQYRRTRVLVHDLAAKFKVVQRAVLRPGVRGRKVVDGGDDAVRFCCWIMSRDTVFTVTGRSDAGISVFEATF
jgi:hypothetical protein